MVADTNKRVGWVQWECARSNEGMKIAYSDDHWVAVTTHEWQLCISQHRNSSTVTFALLSKYFNRLLQWDGAASLYERCWVKLILHVLFPVAFFIIPSRRLNSTGSRWFRYLNCMFLSRSEENRLIRQDYKYVVGHCLHVFCSGCANVVCHCLDRQTQNRGMPLVHWLHNRIK